MRDRIGKGNNALCNVTDLMDHAIREGRRLFGGRRFYIYHDALSAWWSVGAQEYMSSKGFADRQIRGLAFTNEGTRYEGKLPGDTPEYMPLDSNLFSDLETAVRWNVAATRMLDNNDPRKFCLGTPTSCWDAILRTWSHAPSSKRIVQDIGRVFEAIDEVVKAEGIAVDFRELRKGRRREEHRRAELAGVRVPRRENKKLDMLHPDSKVCLDNFLDLT